MSFIAHTFESMKKALTIESSLGEKHVLLQREIAS